ncbi:hypothetical protein [Endozoicomonas numazuensis]|uniref:Uncharacterized protein n=1 Tax=Endozoicomonas numazuensis TaxID=1137799 RepID=A0A081NE72_9GAMM|nr:hypothetical protein [Endozoicomonas numazuensis]KEQ16745.1 hypothetical protein GZ78_18820 [Endozoicomonas numazuensis]
MNRHQIPEGYSPLSPNETRGRLILIKDEHRSNWEEIQRNHAGNFYYTSVLRAIYNLQAVAKGSGEDKHKAGRINTMDLNGAKLRFRIWENNSVLIESLDIQEQATTHSQSGFYAIRYNTQNENWTPVQKEAKQPEFNNKILHEPYIAICGKYDDLAQASNKMVEHIQGAFDLEPGRVSSRGNAYNLFYQAKGFDKKPNIASLASIIQQSQKYKDGVRWLVHGEGAKTFVEALESLSESNSVIKKAEINTEASYKSAINTQYHRVFFSAPRGKGTEKDNLKRLTKNIGMSFSGIQYNDYDLKNPDINTGFRISVEKLAVPAITTGVGATALKTTGISGLVKLYEQAANLPVAGQIGLMVAGAFMVKNNVYPTLSSYGRAFANFGPNTLGKGNQSWQG